MVRLALLGQTEPPELLVQREQPALPAPLGPMECLEWMGHLAPPEHLGHQG